MSAKGENTGSRPDIEQLLSALEARQDALSKKLEFLAECVVGGDLVTRDYESGPSLVDRLSELEQESRAVGRQVSRLNEAVTGLPKREHAASDRDADEA